MTIVGVGVGGIGVSVGGISVGVDGTAVSVGGTGVCVGGNSIGVPRPAKRGPRANVTARSKITATRPARTGGQRIGLRRGISPTGLGGTTGMPGARTVGLSVESFRSLLALVSRSTPST